MPDLLPIFEVREAVVSALGDAATPHRIAVRMLAQRVAREHGACIDGTLFFI